ncbi:EVE domain-containing protein [Sulfuriroseicoccus oceanibius]|uniref:EVE domain-containing protein n=1 Tax=Sulfuriroseicoccus oceanibius TaxID=2707525 RepID=A0A6B3LE64_9BACT|nr:EVE domain-containing protein [Sulfuriroseicoccus oceanibius]QQL45699.1 EVE domain-containing protein [Sulfuriroseicoccus oceanibius]
MKYWLMKSEPDVFSFDDLKACKNQTEPWDGIRNYQARNFMRDEMKVGDLVLFYHSNTKPPGVAGIARIVKEAYPDHTSWDPKSKYFDEKSSADNPRWLMVDVQWVAEFPNYVSLDDLKADSEEGGPLDGLLVTRRGSRLSITPVEEKHFLRICELGGIDAASL